MKKELLKSKNKKAVFICQITQNSLKVIKYLIHNPFKKQLVALEVQPIPFNINDKKLREESTRIFKNLEYKHNPVIISLGRQEATFRYINIPAQSPQEIEKIISFQTSKYLPYPASELVGGYQQISIDKEGYAQINLVVVHKNTIERYLAKH
jgi:Tfp pilus assembly PilM family ATPase